MRLLRRFIPLALIAAPLAALAHVGADGGAHDHVGLLQGFVHPFTGFDHLAAMVAVGLWSALSARRTQDLPWAPLGFAVMLLLGAVLGLSGLQLPAVEPMIAASLLATGLLGSFTTVSSFASQTLALAHDGARRSAMRYAVLSIALCIAAVAAGYTIVDHLR